MTQCNFGPRVLGLGFWGLGFGVEGVRLGRGALNAGRK